MYVLPKNAIEFLDYREFDIFRKNERKDDNLKVGKKYSLKGVECDGFSMPKKVYQIVGKVGEFHGVEVNSVIAKQIDGEDEHKFTLSKNDCNALGIEYVQGLQLFPIGMNWEEEVEEIIWDKNDLSTYPSEESDTVSKIMLRIKGFSDCPNSMIMTPNGKMVNEQRFLQDIKVVTRVPIVYNKNYYIKENSILTTYIVKPNELLFKYGNYICEDGCIYLLVSFGQERGVERKYLKDMDPQETIMVYWNESKHLTIAEYEESKKMETSANTLMEQLRNHLLYSIDYDNRYRGYYIKYNF